jgi:hypothetical protein
VFVPFILAILVTELVEVLLFLILAVFVTLAVLVLLLVTLDV